MGYELKLLIFKLKIISGGRFGFGPPKPYASTEYIYPDGSKVSGPDLPEPRYAHCAATLGTIHILRQQRTGWVGGFIKWSAFITMVQYYIYAEITPLVCRRVALVGVWV